MVNITSIELSRLWQKFLPFSKSICLPQSCLFRENVYTLYFTEKGDGVSVEAGLGLRGGGGGGRGYVSRKRRQFTQILILTSFTSYKHQFSLLR